MGLWRVYPAFESPMQSAPLPVRAADQVRTRHQSQNRKGDGLTIPEAFLARANQVIE
jgi:hypothetical protein